MSGWSRRLGAAYRTGAINRGKKKYDRVKNPEFGEIEAAVANWVKDLGDPERFAAGKDRLRQKYRWPWLEPWVPPIERIVKWANTDYNARCAEYPDDHTINLYEMAFAISQRDTMPENIRKIFRTALPNIATRYDAWLLEEAASREAKAQARASRRRR